MNDYQRRALDIVGGSTYLLSYIRQNQQVQAMDYFVYSTEFDTVPINTTVTQNIQIQADSDFVVTQMGSTETGGGNVLPISSALLQVTDNGSGRTFYNQPSFMGLVTGFAGTPFLLSAPRLIPAQAVLKCDLTAVANNDDTYYLAFMGARIYY